MSEQQRCQATTKKGEQCRAFALPGSPWCWSHDPARADARRKARAAGGKAAGQSRKMRKARASLGTVGEVCGFLAGVVGDLVAGELEVSTARGAIYGCSVLLSGLQAGQLEARVKALEEQLRDEPEKQDQTA